MTSGHKTSEFKISMLALAICGVVVIMQAHAGKLDSMGALGVVGAAVALLYKKSRVKAKSAEDNKPKPPASTGPVMLFLAIGLSMAGCVVNVPAETAEAASQLRADFRVYKNNVAPVSTSAIERAKVDALGIAIDGNLGLLERLTREGSQ